MNDHPQQPVLVVMGPTAVGKTAWAIQKALTENGEIISADSRQVYIPLNIGTAKPTAAELAAVPHHFINELELDEPFSAGIFATEAEKRIADIRLRGKTPIVCGGSTLYLHALIHGLADIPDVPDDVRQSVTEDLESKGQHVLFDELQSVDPIFAQTLDPTKTQRLTRGLEVWRFTGKPISWFHQHQKPPRFQYQPVVLKRDRALLYERINHRVDLMLAQGLLEEVSGLLSAGYAPTLNPLRTIGYQEPIQYLQGELDFDAMVQRLKQHTRHYAKRQITWFRGFDQPLGGLLSPLAGLALFSAYVAVCQETALATHALGEFRLAWWRLGPTELRMGLIAANAVAWAAALRGYTVSGAFDAGAWIATVGLAITWTRSVMVHGAALYALEPRPRGGAGRQSAFSSGGSTARNSELNRSVNCPSSAVTRS